MGSNSSRICSSLQGKIKVPPCAARFTSYLRNDVERMRERHMELGSVFVLTLSQFTFVTGIAEHNARECFTLLDTQLNNVVDAFETISCVCMVSSLFVEEKLAILFSLFDFGKRKALSLDEVVILFHSVISGIAKFDPKITVPETENVDAMVKKMFSRIGKTIDDEVSLEDFTLFCEKYSDVSSVLMFSNGAASIVDLRENDVYVDKDFNDIEKVLYGETEMVLSLGHPQLFLWKDSPDEAVLFLPDECKYSRLCRGLFSSSAVAEALEMISSQPRLLQNLFITTGQENKGRYTLQLFYRAEWVVLSVDNKQLCSRCTLCPSCGQSAIDSLGFVHTTDDPKEIWATIIEKAMAKLLGNYVALAQLSILDILEMMTAGCARFVPIRTSIESEAFYKLIHHSINAGIASARCDKIQDRRIRLRNKERLARKGIAHGVSYSIQSIKNGFVQVRVPNDAKKHRYEGAQVEQDGSMWMPIADFREVFSQLTVCKIFDAERWGFQTRRSRGEVFGDFLSPTWFKNDQHCLVVFENGTSLHISVHNDLIRGPENSALMIALVKHDFGKLENETAIPFTVITKGSVLGHSALDQNKNSSDLEIELGVGKYMIVILSEDETGVAEYTLTVRTLQSDSKETKSQVIGTSEVEWMDRREARDIAMALSSSNRATKGEIESLKLIVQPQVVSTTTSHLENHINALLVTVFTNAAMKKMTGKSAPS